MAAGKLLYYNKKIEGKMLNWKKEAWVLRF